MSCSHAAPPHEPSSPAADLAGAASRDFRGRGELILVVDDEVGVRALLQTVLTDHGYKVVTAADAREGIRSFSAQTAQVALVITDRHMPHNDDDSFAARLRAMRPDVRILNISGLREPEGEPAGPSARPREPFLPKPFRPAALLATVHKLLHSPESPKS